MKAIAPLYQAGEGFLVHADETTPNRLKGVEVASSYGSNPLGRGRCASAGSNDSDI
ncbi:hypothetical protein [Roseofilum sp. Guam]|uniref:hypothetical protein n=1 Tax=Roseofilum sp. Guam TaxID=2821502 RepID=UPI001B06FCBB|nr:hypothetical protein [Roseofilum sp. Guam]MBP0029147.1 hypothetical protein [Roseofilum sp. Guam]